MEEQNYPHYAEPVESETQPAQEELTALDPDTLGETGVTNVPMGQESPNSEEDSDSGYNGGKADSPTY